MIGINVECHDNNLSNEERNGKLIKRYFINGDVICYLKGKDFQNKHCICSKTLQRNRKYITSMLPEDEHKDYFYWFEGAFYYNENILWGKKFGKEKPVCKDIIRETYVLDHSDYPLLSVASPIFKKLVGYDWHFACGSSYSCKVEVYQCVEKMNTLYDRISEKFNKADVTMFFTTEHNDERTNHHNHFVLSVRGGGYDNVMRDVRELILSIGTVAPFIETYDKNRGYLNYMIKYIKEYPDGWAVLSNSKAQIDRIRPDEALELKRA